MHLITDNPYRIVGLLIGGTAREQDRQIKRLKQFIEADQDPENDFSFPTLGPLNRTTESVNDAASKLNLDSDKMNAALFWFYNGNSITDETAFESIKEADLDQVLDIWTKLTSKGEVSQRNASAFNNLGTLYLSGILDGTNTNEAILEQGISLKLKFLESDFVKGFKALATDETFKTTKKELQILFLNQLYFEIEKNEKINSGQFINILSKEDFSAKEEFLKGFVEKPIEEIEKRIEESKTKRKVNKVSGIKIGEELIKQINSPLNLLKSILGISNLKYTSIADKAANEILQCSIDYFNFYQEKESDIDYVETALKLARSTQNIAIGKLTKDRILDTLNTIEEVKERELIQAIQLLQHIKESYEENEKKINQQVKKMKETDVEILMGRKYIDQNAVNDNIKNFINWGKVNEMLETILTDGNLHKIKESSNNDGKKEFIDLANWLKENSASSTLITRIINKYNKIPPKIPFKIISSEITNTDSKPLYTKFIRYIGINLKVEVTDEKKCTLYVKYITPNGKIDRNAKTSPIGYTTSNSHSLTRSTKSIRISGWGNDEKCTFDIGEHKIEIYIDEYLIHSKSFVVDLSPSEKLNIELRKAEDKMSEIRDTQFFKEELNIAHNEMNKIKEWHFLRSQADREKQINDQTKKINNLIEWSNEKKKKQINAQKLIIDEIKDNLEKAIY
jgi:hypothetical protein